ncbi:MAG TPA: transketolase C-terminal domain-containing protein, partial [Arenicellales bacterium]|nr:transketolase C-terminal domain-containing protein [Arenicellales bacterium]
DLPSAITHGSDTADVGLIGVGMTYGVIIEALEILDDKGISAQYHQPRTLWPMLDETPEFTRRTGCTIVVEYNATGQLARLIAAHGGDESSIHSILGFDGVPLRAHELVQRVIEILDSRRHKVA